MRVPNPRQNHLTLWSLIVISTVLLCAPTLSAQTPLPGSSDPGPRPAGIENAGFCPVTFAPAKFTDFCIDTNQPAHGTADGAGNVLAKSGALGTFWFQALTVFETFATVTAPATSPTTIQGLGPSFNGEHCFECHSQPTVGGASGGIITIGTNKFTSTINPFAETIGTNANCPPSSTGCFVQNPEINSASHDDATNSLPCFLESSGTCITLGDFSASNFAKGPVVETRFIKAVPADAANNTDAVGAGGVAELFVFSGRSDLPPGNSCKIGQEDFQTQMDNGNISFRTPTPTFGLGLVENTPDPTLINNATISKTAAGSNFGSIEFGVFNRSGNDGTITRFGWKAQNKSLLMFAGEAANVEMGVTNELFSTEKTFGGVPSNLNCINFNTYPEDQILNTEQGVVPPATGDPSQISSVIENLAVFMRLNGAASQCNWNSKLDPTTGVPQCLAFDSNVTTGQQLFGSIVPPAGSTSPNVGIGCVLCHTDQLTTAPSLAPSLNNAPFHPFSDFALHHMGAGDADSVVQGSAGGDQFRTAPLWGAGQRFFFFHDGRFTNLPDAIQGHCPVASQTATATFPASEACAVITKFNNLSPANQLDIVKFLRSL